MAQCVTQEFDVEKDEWLLVLVFSWDVFTVIVSVLLQYLVVVPPSWRFFKLVLSCRIRFFVLALLDFLLFFNFYFLRTNFFFFLKSRGMFVFFFP